MGKPQGTQMESEVILVCLAELKFAVQELAECQSELRAAKARLKAARAAVESLDLGQPGLPLKG